MENTETKVEEENNNGKQTTEENKEEVTGDKTSENREKENGNKEAIQESEGLEKQIILENKNDAVEEVTAKAETALENEDSLSVKNGLVEEENNKLGIDELTEKCIAEIDSNANVEQVINLDTNVISDIVTDLDEEISEKGSENSVPKHVELDKNEIDLNKINASEEIAINHEQNIEKVDKINNGSDENVTNEIKAKLKRENVENTVRLREKQDKSKNKEKRVTFLEQNFEQEKEEVENDFNLQSAKSNESKVVWEIVSETKGDEIVTEFKNERKKSETESYKSNEAKQIWKDYGNATKETDVEMGSWNNSGRDKSVFMSYLEERQREKTLSISDFDSVNDFPTMPYDRSTGSDTAHAPPTQCNHMCGSLFGQCGSVRQEALVQTFSHPKPQDKKYDVGYTGPVSLTEILQERQIGHYDYQQPAAYNAWGAIGSKPNTQDRMCRFQELDEDLDSLEKVLMGNGASTSNSFRNNEVKNGYGLCNVDCNKASGVLDPLGSNSDTYEYIKSGVLSLMKRETKEWENKAVDLNNEVLALQKDVKRKEQEILRLQREVHKLKSVLQQATSFSNDGDLLSSLQEVHGMAGQKAGTTNKKQGVSAESSQPNKTATDIHVKRFEKDFRSKQLIKAAIMDNDFLKNLDLSQVRELVESMYPKECSKGSYVIREGEAGAHLYVAAEGEFEVIKEHKVLGRIGPGKAFGELAILYNCTRTASIRVIKDSKVWVLDRRVFQRIMMQTGLQRLEDNIHFLRSVPLLKNLSDDVLTKISDVLEVEFYPSGHHIIRQGASGDTFFILSQGSVKVTQRLQGSAEDQEIRILERGDYFGEQALLKEDCRTASVIALPPGVECLTLDRVSFIQLIGDLSEFQEKDYGDRTRISIDRPPSASSIHSEPDQELAHIRLDDLDVLATLGVGGFGRVELVQCLYDKSQTFALKCMKKQHIVETHQQEHVYSEKSIMMSCRHPFICRLYRTFKDAKYVYMLTEACLGGEVWTILRDRGCFDDATCCFISACVIEALHYLHSRGIVFRDLKPENLLLDSQGYVKLVDFGFAKRLGVSSGKTWTFCGTPEYVAPEVILNKGHDKAVDCWALGILIHELLTGAPPFSGSDPMKVYNMILKGIDMIDFPRHVTRTAQALIKKLCRDSPAERLGCQKGGLADIKKNKWFQGFDWDGLRQRTLIPPIVPQVRSPTDTANFDQYPKEMHIPEDETSNWDADF